MRIIRRVLLLLAIASVAAPVSAQAPLPRIVTKDGRHALMVDGEPFLMLGAQVDRITLLPQEMAKALPGFRQHHAVRFKFRFRGS